MFSVCNTLLLFRKSTLLTKPQTLPAKSNFCLLAFPSARVALLILKPLRLKLLYSFGTLTCLVLPGFGVRLAKLKLL